MSETLLPSNIEGQDDDRRTRHVGYVIASLIVFVVFIWGAFAPLQSAAIAPGVVQVEGKRKAVQHLEGGILAQILVANGEWVEEEQPLLVLDMARYLAERDILQGRLYSQRATVDRLKAERDDLPDVLFRDALINAGLTDDRAVNAISNEVALFSARSADRNAEKEVLASRKKGLQLLVESKQSVEGSLRQEIEDLRDLLVDGYVDKQRLRQLERSRTETLGELTDLKVSIEEVSLRVSQLVTSFKKRWSTSWH